MDFAKKQLEKYGWSEGKGLGKNESGISTAIKPKLKFDNAGIGHDPGEQFTNNWWEDLFNRASQNIQVQVDAKQVKVKVKDKNAVEISTKKSSVKHLKKTNSLEYDTFIKTAKLTGSSVEQYTTDPVVYSEPDSSCKMSDEKLFAMCGYRTGHKAAYHGLGLSGKLSRIEKQEKLLLKKLKKVSLSDDKTKTEKKLKKLKKQKDESNKCILPLESVPSTSSASLKKTSKKKKSVSFNETVIKISAEDTSFDSEEGSLRDENSNDTLNNNSGSDEGIEQDLENNNNDQEEDNHKAFEEARFNFSDLSKAERKKLKKKRKLEGKKSSSTEVFLQSLDIVPQDQIMEDEKEIGSKKRKSYEDLEDIDSKRTQTDFPDRQKLKKSKRKRKKQRRQEAKQINSITKSLDNFCRISDCE